MVCFMETIYSDTGQATVKRKVRRHDRRRPGQPRQRLVGVQNPFVGSGPGDAGGPEALLCPAGHRAQRRTAGAAAHFPLRAPVVAPRFQAHQRDVYATFRGPSIEGYHKNYCSIMSTVFQIF